jgi:hypothetical protein
MCVADNLGSDILNYTYRYVELSGISGCLGQNISLQRYRNYGKRQKKALFILRLLILLKGRKKEEHAHLARTATSTQPQAIRPAQKGNVT